MGIESNVLELGPCDSSDPSMESIPSFCPTTPLYPDYHPCDEKDKSCWTAATLGYPWIKKIVDETENGGCWASALAMQAPITDPPEQEHSWRGEGRGPRPDPSRK